MTPESSQQVPALHSPTVASPPTGPCLWAVPRSNSVTFLSFFTQRQLGSHDKPTHPQPQPPSFQRAVQALLCHLQQRVRVSLPQQPSSPESVSRLRQSLSSSPRRSANKASTTQAVCSSKVAIAAYPHRRAHGDVATGEFNLWIWASVSQSCTGYSFWKEHDSRLLPMTAQHANICSLNRRHSSYGCGLVSKSVISANVS